MGKLAKLGGRLLGKMKVGAKALFRKGKNFFKKTMQKIKEKFKKILDKIKGKGKPEPLENGPYIKDGKPHGRPGPTGKEKQKFEQEVYDKCVDPDGVLRDPNTGDVINWKPGQSRKGVVDFGHTQGNSYKKMFEKYKNREITLDELKEFQSNPDNFRLETPSANRSHKYE